MHIPVWLKPRRLIPLLTALVSFGVDLLGVLQVLSVTLVEGIILFVLGMLATDAVTERLGFFARIEKRVKKIERHMTPRISAEFFFKDRESLQKIEERVEEAKNEICMTGISLTEIIGTHLSLLQKKLDEGCRVKLLLLNPYSETVKLAAKITSPEKSAKALRSQIETSLKIVEPLTKQYRKLAIRLLDDYPPFSLFLVDSEKPYGKIKVELYSYKSSPSERVHFFLHKSDKYWYSHFHDQFLKLWKSSKKL